jgi:phenylalanine-4-hydroxylase
MLDPSTPQQVIAARHSESVTAPASGTASSTQKRTSCVDPSGRQHSTWLAVNTKQTRMQHHVASRQTVQGLSEFRWQSPEFTPLARVLRMTTALMNFRPRRQ